MLKVGDYVEILEPTNKTNYSRNWIYEMRERIGTKTKIDGVFLDARNEIYYTLGSHWTCDDDHLKLLSRNPNIKTIDINETVVITTGKHKGETDRVKACYTIDSEIYYNLQNLGNVIPSEHVKPVEQMTGLF